MSPTEIRANGSKMLGQTSDSIEALLDVLAHHPLNRMFERVFIEDLGNGSWRFHGNFLTMSHVFDTPEPGPVDKHFVAADPAQSSFGEQSGVSHIIVWNSVDELIADHRQRGPVTADYLFEDEPGHKRGLRSRRPAPSSKSDVIRINPPLTACRDHHDDGHARRLTSLTLNGETAMTRNIPDVHALDRVIPPGKVLLAEYGDISADEPRPKETVLDSKLGWGRTTVKLAAVTAGWAIAGSMLRWDNGCFAVRYEIDGVLHGSRYADFDQALEHFDRIPGERTRI